MLESIPEIYSRLKGKLSALKREYLLLLPALLLLIASLLQRARPKVDEAVYIGIGKYLFSAGSSGFMEPFRPVLFPLLLGAGWKAGLDPLLLGRVIVALSTLSVFYLTFVVTNKEFDTLSGLVAATLLAITPIYLTFSFRLLSGIFTTLLALISIYSLQRDKPHISGLFAALAFLGRFPQALLFFAILLPLLYRRKLKKSIMFSVAYFLPVLVYLSYNHIYFGSPLAFLAGAGVAASKAGFYNLSLSFYFKELLLQGPLFILAIPGAYLALKKGKYLFVSLLLFFFVFFLYFPNKQIRFALIFLPYLSALTAVGFSFLLKTKRSVSIFVLALLVFAQLISFQIGLHKLNFKAQPELMQFYHQAGDIISEREQGYVLANTPVPVLIYSDRKLKSLRMSYAFRSYNRNREATHIVINSCQLLCRQQDTSCKRKKQRFLAKLEAENKKLFSTKYKSCQLAIYAPE